MTKGEIWFLDKVCHVTYEWKGELKENVYTKFEERTTNLSREK